MAQYRKKPVVIEAVQWDGNLETLSIFPKEDIENVKLRDGDLYIQTLEGEMKANVGDYIIRGVKGEYYPCKPDIFEATYEIVQGSPDTSSPNIKTNNMTAMQELIAWGDDMLLKHPQKLLSFGEAIDKAVSLLDKEKEQMIGLLQWMNKVASETPMRLETDLDDIVEQYYNETYKKQ